MKENNTILIVDDEEHVRNALVRLLEELPCKTLTARSAIEAIEVLRRNRVDLVVSDHRMPGSTGLELLQRMKSEHPRTARILLTAYDDKETVIDAINKGEVFRFLTKPWDPAELVEAVQTGLERLGDHLGLMEKLRRQLGKANLETVMALAEAIELKDPYTKGHCTRVRKYALQIAHRAGLSSALTYHLGYASLLHDCGKLGVSEAILLSTAPLTEQQRRTMARHSIWGFEITNKVEHLKVASLFIRQHHERWDGNGYPDGLSGEDIHLCARIMAIADAYDALTTDRPYRKAAGPDDARNVLMACRGTQFDPELVEAFVEPFEETAGQSARAHGDEADRSPATVLLVDDEPRVLNAIKRTLLDEEYRLLTATNGEDGLSILKNSRVDVVISDQKMPGMTGLEFLKTARALMPDMARILLTGFLDIGIAMDAINEAGIHKFILKPWNAPELKSAIRDAMEWRAMSLTAESFLEEPQY